MALTPLLSPDPGDTYLGDWGIWLRLDKTNAEHVTGNMAVGFDELVMAELRGNTWTIAEHLRDEAG